MPLKLAYSVKALADGDENKEPFARMCKLIIFSWSAAVQSNCPEQSPGVQVPIRLAVSINQVPLKLAYSIKALADGDENKELLVGDVFPKPPKDESAAEPAS